VSSAADLALSDSSHFLIGGAYRGRRDRRRQARRGLAPNLAGWERARRGRVTFIARRRPDH